MGGSFRDYLMGLSVLLLIMGGYQLTVARWLEPPEVDRAPIAKRVLRDNDETLVDLYPNDAWQRGRSIRLKTQDGMLLFQNWEQDTEDRSSGKKWRLWPITMVIGRGLQADGSEQPIVIEAAQGAVIEFSDPLDVMSGVAPTIQRGQLMGEVHIRRINARADEDAHDGSAYQITRSAEADRDQTLDIRTANVGIDRRKIWTTEAIHMQVGRATMVGRDLTLHLASSAGGNSTQSNIARSLDRMELIYLRDLTLPLGDADDPASADQGLVQIRCDGRIEYDFAMDQLLLDRKVRLVRTTRKALAVSAAMHPASTPIDPTESDRIQDRFECDLLRLTLRDPLNSNRTRETALDWIDRIEATGNPVRLVMPTQGFQLSASQVQFDPMEGWLIAEPMRVPGQRPDSSDAIRIQHGDLIAMLSRIVYRFDPKNPKQLGTVEVAGRGDLQYDSAESVLKSLHWQDNLRISPLDVATPDAMDVRFGVWCDGGVEATLSDGGTFTTDRIEGVLKPVSNHSNSGHSNSGHSNSGHQNSGLGPDDQPGTSINHQWFPDRFAAIGHVQINSPTLVASTRQMNLFFEQKILHPGTPVATESDSSLRQWVNQPNASGTKPSADLKSSGPRPPATIQGDEVTAKLTFGDRALTATDLSVIGHVKVTHPLELKSSRSSQNNAPPPSLLAVLTGDHLRVRDGGGSDVLQLGSRTGMPARLQMGDGYFIGPEIQVRPDDNYVWIPSAGEFVLPSQFLPPLNRLSGNPDSATDTNGTDSARWTRSPRCRFGGSMTFDGQVATLDGGVDLEAAMVTGDQPAEIIARGDELKFILETPVELRTPATFQTTRLKQISLLQTGSQPVRVRVDQFTGDGIHESRHELAVASLNWIPAPTPTPPVDQDKLAGQLVAPGPGSYRGWIRGVKKDEESRSTQDSGDSKSASIDVPGMIEDTTSSSKSAPDETIISGVHLVFQEAMRGDLVAKSLTFTRGVRIARRILADFNETFEASDLDQLGLDDLTLDCDQVRLSIDPSVTVPTSKFTVPGRRSSRQPPALEVEASGGVVFRSRTDRGLSEATADRCSYAVAKDLVTIQGAPGRPARFQQTDPVGKPLANLAIRTMTLRLKPFELISSQIESLQTGVLPTAANRNR